jgi:hypothetical protein
MCTARRDDSRYPKICFVAGLLNKNKQVKLYKSSASCLTHFTFCRIISISARDSKFQQYRQCAYNVTSKRVRATVVAVEKAKSTTFSERVFVASGVQRTKRMRVIILSSVACPDLQ